MRSPVLSSGRPFAFRTPHGNEPRFYFSGVDTCLVTSDFDDGAKKHSISGKKLRMSLPARGSGVGNRSYLKPPPYEDNESPQAVSSHHDFLVRLITQQANLLAYVCDVA